MVEQALRVRIHGRVQGVWFRAWTTENACELGLAGWVRNREDGSLEARFEGSEEAVRQMMERAREGPPMAFVERIEQRHEETSGETGFHQLPTI